MNASTLGRPDSSKNAPAAATPTAAPAPARGRAALRGHSFADGEALLAPAAETALSHSGRGGKPAADGHGKGIDEKHRVKARPKPGGTGAKNAAPSALGAAFGRAAAVGAAQPGEPQSLGHYIEAGVSTGARWAENAENAVFDRAAESVAGVPVVGTVASGIRRVQHAASQMRTGALSAVGGMAGGVVDAAASPLQTARGVGTLLGHTGGIQGTIYHTGQDIVDAARGNRTWGSVASRTFDPRNQERRQEDARYLRRVGNQIARPYREAAEQGRYGEAVGRGAVEVGSLLLGGESLAAERAGVEATQTASTAGRAGEISETVQAGRVGETVEGANAGGRVAAEEGALEHAATIPSEAPRAPAAVQGPRPPAERVQMPAVDAAGQRLPGAGEAVPHGPPAYAQQTAEPATRGSFGSDYGGPSWEQPMTPSQAAEVYQSGHEIEMQRRAAAQRAQQAPHGADPVAATEMQEPPTTPMEAPTEVREPPTTPMEAPTQVREGAAPASGSPTGHVGPVAAEQAGGPRIGVGNLDGIKRNQITIADSYGIMLAQDEGVVVEIAHDLGITVEQFLVNNGCTSDTILAMARDVDASHPLPVRTP